MTLRDRVPIEPLPPERIDRIEQRVVHAAAAALARPARPALWPWALAATTAAAAALAVVVLRKPAPPSAPPIAVTTDARGARLDLGDAVVAAGLDTRFSVARPGGGIDVRLDHGTVRLDVAPRRERPPLWVHAGDVGVRVVGTAFSVRRDGTLVEVAVEHGVVEVHQAGTVRRLHAGERWSSSDGRVAAAVEPPAAPAPAAKGSGRDSAPPGATIGTAPPDDDRAPTGPAVDVDLLDDRRGPVAPPPGAPTKRPPSAGTGATDDGTSRAPRVTAGPLGDLRARVLGEALAPAVDISAATPAEAAAAYQRGFLEGRGADASAALYGLARTQHVALGKHPEALKHLDAYLIRFPAGAELEAVLWLRLRILCRAGFDEPCRIAAHAYLKRYAGTKRGELAQRVTETR